MPLNDWLKLLWKDVGQSQVSGRRGEIRRRSFSCEPLERRAALGDVFGVGALLGNSVALPNLDILLSFMASSQGTAAPVKASLAAPMSSSGFSPSFESNDPIASTVTPTEQATPASAVGGSMNSVATILAAQQWQGFAGGTPSVRLGGMARRQSRSWLRLRGDFDV